MDVWVSNAKDHMHILHQLHQFTYKSLFCTREIIIVVVVVVVVVIGLQYVSSGSLRSISGVDRNNNDNRVEHATYRSVAQIFIAIIECRITNINDTILFIVVPTLA